MSGLDCEEIISKFYHRGTRQWSILTTHSRCVAELAVEIAKRHPELGADIVFVREAALLHDIGIIGTDAPSIDCHGMGDYICHGILGRTMLEEIGLPRHALVCERHTGSGLTADYIATNNLPLPHRDMLPITIEEKIVCYADKFYSKGKNLTERKSISRIIASLEKFGQESAGRFMELDALLHVDIIDTENHG